MTTNKENKSGMLIINGGQLGGSVRTKNVQDNGNDLEPLYPAGITEAEEQEEQEENEDQLEPLLPAQAR
jgi:hypothetical protein